MIWLFCLIFNHSYRLRDDQTVLRWAKISYCGRCKEFFSIDDINTKNNTFDRRLDRLVWLFNASILVCIIFGHEYTLHHGIVCCSYCKSTFSLHDRIRLENQYDCFAWRLRQFRERKDHDKEEVRKCVT